MSDGHIIETIRRTLAGGDHELAVAFLRSAVAVPLISVNGGLEIVFELRCRNLRRSPGEVGFPGGRIEEGEDPWQAVLRELEEELGVPGDRVECLGRLPEQQRRRDELIVPYVARLAPDVQPVADGIEVEDVFTVPLQMLLNAEFQHARLIERHTLSDDFPRQYLPGGVWERSIERSLRYLIYNNHLIWGLSANILLQLLQLLQSAGDFYCN